jgi:hypothetical protein
VGLKLPSEAVLYNTRHGETQFALKRRFLGGYAPFPLNLRPNLRKMNGGFLSCFNQKPKLAGHFVHVIVFAVP